MDTISNAYALVIGVAGYQRITPLPPSVTKDARDICETLVNPQICAYPRDNVQLLLDADATGSAIRRALAGLAKRAPADATILLYFSGHGGRIESGPSSGEYLLPVDTETSSPEAMTKTAISGAEFADAIRSFAAQRVVVLLDCCHAGGIGHIKGGETPAFKSGLPDSYLDRLKEGRGRVILASSRSSELSWVMPGMENSLFTHHLLSGIKGGIVSEDGFIRIFDLFEYIQPRVTGDQRQQHPVFKAEVEENFPIALRLGGQKGPASKVGGRFRFDAYVSYVDREPDAGWVWNTLVPRLEAAGLRIAVSGDVEEPGVERVVNMERGIGQSKRTIIVLSENYLTDNMAGFENVLAQTMGIQEGRHRLLPVVMGPIDRARLPVRLSMLTSLDFASPQRSERQFERLITALKAAIPSS